MKHRLLLPLAAAAALALPASAHAWQDQEKVTICHQTGSETHPTEEITVALPAATAHLTHHGDVIGPCPPPPPPPVTVEVPVITPVPGPIQTVQVPGPVQTVEVPGAVQTKIVVVTPKRKSMKCERRFNKGGRLVIVCQRKTNSHKPKVKRHEGSAPVRPNFTG